MAHAPLQWNGIHHLALYTRDLDETVTFYRDLLGMETGTIEPSPRGRHCFVHIESPDSGRPGLHFWENPAMQSDPLANREQFNSGTGTLAHFALYLPDEASEQELRNRLASIGIDIVEFDRLGTFAFWDPNGVMLEVVPPIYDTLNPR